jgi:hypothetical protein
MLMHQPEPATTLSHCARLLRPGGAVVAFDLFDPPITEPDYPPLQRSFRLLLDGMRRRGAHPETSRRYAEVSATAGLELVSQRGVFMPVPPVAILNEAVMLLSAARQTLVELELIGHTDLDDLIAQLAPDRAALRHATTPLGIELVARKPGASTTRG